MFAPWAVKRGLIIHGGSLSAAIPFTSSKDSGNQVLGVGNTTRWAARIVSDLSIGPATTCASGTTANTFYFAKRSLFFREQVNLRVQRRINDVEMLDPANFFDALDISLHGFRIVGPHTSREPIAGETGHRVTCIHESRVGGHPPKTCAADRVSTFRNNDFLRLRSRAAQYNVRLQFLRVRNQNIHLNDSSA